MAFANATAPKTASEKAAETRKPAISRDDFLANAEPIEINIAGYPVVVDPRVFSSGSYGYGVVGAPPKIQIKLGKTVVDLCLSLSLVVSKSKPQG